MDNKFPPAPPHSKESSRSPHSVVGRGATAEQPFTRLVDENGDPSAFAVGNPRIISVDGSRASRQVPPIPAELLRRIYDEDRELNRGAVARLSTPAPTWTDIAIAALSVAALVMFLFFLDGGWIVR